MDGKAIESAAENAGIHTKNFFNSVAHKVADIFLPDPWTIIFIFISIIAALILIACLYGRYCKNAATAASHETNFKEDRQQILDEIRSLYQSKSSHTAETKSN